MGNTSIAAVTSWWTHPNKQEVKALRKIASEVVKESNDNRKKLSKKQTQLFDGFNDHLISAFRPPAMINSGLCCWSGQQFIYTRHAMNQLIRVVLRTPTEGLEPGSREYQKKKMRMREEMKMVK